MKNKIEAKVVGAALMALADALTTEDCEFSADEILEYISLETLSDSEHAEISKWLST